MISSDHSMCIHVSYVSSQPSLSRCVRSGHSLSKSFTLEAVNAILQFGIPFCNETMVPEAGHALEYIYIYNYTYKKHRFFIFNQDEFPASQRKLCQDILKLRSLLRSNDHDELPTSALFGLHDTPFFVMPLEMTSYIETPWNADTSDICCSLTGSLRHNSDIEL